MPPLNLTGKTYYFSASDGDDKRSKEAAKEKSSPWKTLDKLNDFMPNLSPGDSILFKKGDIFHGSITIRKSGLTESPIYFGNYGEGNLPVWKATYPVTKWEKVSPGIFKTTISKNKIPRIQLVMADGEIMEMGRFPNKSHKEGGFLKIDELIEPHRIKNEALNGKINWKGGEVVVRKNHWIIDSEKIIDHSVEQISFAPSNKYNLNKDFGFFIQNHIETLDEFGEWYFNSDTQELFMYFGIENPTNHDIEFAIYDDIVTTLTNTRNIILDGLVIEGANRNGISLLGGDNFTVQNCIIRNSGQDGIYVTNNSNLKIINSEIHNSLNNGINLKFGNLRCSIIDNLISNTYLIPGMGQNGDNNGFGIFSISDNDIIKRNQLFNSGYIGIGFRGNGTVVEENLIKRFCLTKNDGSGIYTYTGNSNIEFKNRLIKNNIVIFGEGNLDGTNLTPGLNHPPVEGIYIDDNASGVQIIGNSIAHIANNGINIHNSRNIEVRKNLIFDAMNSVNIGNDGRGEDVSNIIIQENVFITKKPDQFTVGITDKKNRIKYLGVIKGNFHYSPFGNEDLIEINTIDDDGLKTALIINFREWSEKWNIEKESTCILGKSQFYETVQYLTPDLTGKINLNKIPTNFTCTSGCSLDYSVNKFFDNGHLIIKHQQEKSTMKIDIGEIKGNSTYEIIITAKAISEIDAYMFFRHRKEPYTKVSNLKKIRLDKLGDQFKVILENYIDLPEASLIINHVGKETYYGVEDISIRKIEGKTTDINQFFKFSYNFSDRPAVVTFENSGITIENNLKSTIDEIPPYSGALFF